MSKETPSETPPELALYTTKEIAEMFSVTTETVRAWIANGTLPAIQLPGTRGKWRVRREDAIAFANSKYATDTGGGATEFI